MLASRLLLLSLGFSFTACAVDGADSPPTRDQIRDSAGKGDGADLCDAQGWYGDGLCDAFCINPDPDCAGAILLSYNQSGGSFIVTIGTDVLVQLTEQPGYEWQVVQTDRTFGHPAEVVRVDGYVQLRWLTGGTLFDQTGVHTITLGYDRVGATAPLPTLSYTLDVRPPGTR